MKSPGRGKPGERRGASTPSAPVVNNPCVASGYPSCDYEVSGVSYGTPCKFCCHPEILKGYANKCHTSYEVRVVRLSEAWLLCGGRFYVRVGDAK